MENKDFEKNMQQLMEELEEIHKFDIDDMREDIVTVVSGGFLTILCC